MNTLIVEGDFVKVTCAKGIIELARVDKTFLDAQRPCYVTFFGKEVELFDNIFAFGGWPMTKDIVKITPEKLLDDISYFKKQIDETRELLRQLVMRNN